MRRALISATPHAAVRLCPRASACMLGQCASSRVPAPDVATDGRSHARRRLLHQAQRACRCGRAWRAGGERRRPHPMAPCDVRRGWSSRLQRGCSACRGRRASKLDAPAPRPRRGPLLRQSRELVRVPVRVPAPTTEESHVYCFRADPHTFRIFAFSYTCGFTPLSVNSHHIHSFAKVIARVFQHGSGSGFIIYKKPIAGVCVLCRVLSKSKSKR